MRLLEKVFARSQCNFALKFLFHLYIYNIYCCYIILLLINQSYVTDAIGSLLEVWKNIFTRTFVDSFEQLQS